MNIYLKVKVKTTIKNRHFKEDLQKSLKTKKCDIVDMHNDYFLMGNWMLDDSSMKRQSLPVNTSHRDERSPEEIPDEEFISNKVEMMPATKKKSLTEINKPMNAYEMRENMPIKVKNNNGYRFEEKLEDQKEKGVDPVQEENKERKQSNKFGFLKRKQNVSKPKIQKSPSKNQ